jgi:TolB protein
MRTKYKSAFLASLCIALACYFLALSGCRAQTINVTPINSSLSTPSSSLPTRIVLTVPSPTTVATTEVSSTVQFPPLPKIGGKIAFSTNRTGVFEIGVLDLNSGSVKILTTSPEPGDAEPVWAKDGSFIAFNSGREGTGQLEIYRMAPDGTSQQLVAGANHSGGNFSPAVSPDGKRILFHSNRDGNMEVYVIDADGLNEQNLTKDPSNDITASWSPDGSKIIFASDRSGIYQIYTMNPDGSEVNSLYGEKDNVLIRPRYSPDGKLILFGDQIFGSLEYGLATINADGSGFRMITTGHGQYTQGTWVTNNMVVYSGRESEKDAWQLYLISLDNTNLIQITTGNVDYRNPSWTPK